MRFALATVLFLVAASPSALGIPIPNPTRLTAADHGIAFQGSHDSSDGWLHGPICGPFTATWRFTLTVEFGGAGDVLRLTAVDDRTGPRVADATLAAPAVLVVEQSGCGTFEVGGREVEGVAEYAVTAHIE